MGSLEWRSTWDCLEVRLLVSSLTKGIMRVPSSFHRVVGMHARDNGCKEFRIVPGAQHALHNKERVSCRSITRCPALS